jgi:AraC family transcriptional regulator
MDPCPNYHRIYNPFRADGAKAMTRKLANDQLMFMEIVGDANYGVTAPVRSIDAFIVQLSLKTCARSDLFVAGKHMDGVDHGEGSVQIHDLRRSPVSDIRDPFHVLYCYLPRRVLNALPCDKPVAPIDEMQLQPLTPGGRDPAVEHLMLSLLPALERPAQLNNLFAEHVTLALGAHVSSRYAATRPPLPIAKGGLSPRQQRRAIEMLHANLDGALSLSALAAECGLSVRHFARAFKESTGLPPHRYLLKQRIERARGMLIDSERSLLDIALACGFADQSHFTRVFTAAMQISPGTFRRDSKDVDG